MDRIEWIGMEEFSKCEWLSEWVKKWTLNIQSVLFHLYVSTKIIPLMVLVLILREICTANIWLWQCIKKGYEYDVLCSRQTHFLERMSTKCWFVLSLKNPCPVCVPVPRILGRMSAPSQQWLAAGNIHWPFIIVTFNLSVVHKQTTFSSSVPIQLCWPILLSQLC